MRYISSVANVSNHDLALCLDSEVLPVRHLGVCVACRSALALPEGGLGRELAEPLRELWSMIAFIQDKPELVPLLDARAPEVKLRKYDWHLWCSYA